MIIPPELELWIKEWKLAGMQGDWSMTSDRHKVFVIMDFRDKNLVRALITPLPKNKYRLEWWNGDHSLEYSFDRLDDLLDKASELLRGQDG